MSEISQISIYLIVLISLSVPLGLFMADVYEGRRHFLSPLLAPVEGKIYKVAGTLTGQDPTLEMNWKTYAFSMLVFNILGLVAVYLLERLQNWLPLNPEGLVAVSPDTAFNAAVSFASNTNWQSYAGETTMSYLTQMLGLSVQNFLSAATGMAVLIAFIRGFNRQKTDLIGSFWVDLVRSILYVLLPLSLILAVALNWQGVVQTFSGHAEYTSLERQSIDKLPLGPAASQVAIKQLGTNGGGFYNMNSSHPLENPTPLSNFLEMLAILLIPASLCHTFGRLCGNAKQGWSIFAAMLLIYASFLALCFHFEQDFGSMVGKGNLEGKEVRFGIANSAIWATATTAASNGSVNCMHDSLSPMGGVAPLLLMQLGEVIFGGVGCGLYGMLTYAIIGVFIAGLMVGRTPEYLSKKIESFEMKMSSLIILIPPALVLIGTAIAASHDFGTSSILNPGPHGFSEILYAFSSAGNNNGSAFAGLNANTPFYNFALGVCMFIARYWLAIPTLAIAGSLAAKKKVPSGAGTLPTDTPLFVIFLMGVVLIFGVLTFVPALAVGPIIEHLRVAYQ
ncbi:MAG: potassium-transporting ATPase subunit KdpA [Candidatus Obscuribacterales bacterium]